MRYYLNFFMMACATCLISFHSNEVEQLTYELSIAKTECLVHTIRTNIDAREMYKEGLINLETMNIHDDILKTVREIISDIN